MIPLHRYTADIPALLFSWATVFVWLALVALLFLLAPPAKALGAFSIDTPHDGSITFDVACDLDGDRGPCDPPLPDPEPGDQSCEDCDLDDGRDIPEPPTDPEPPLNDGRDGDGPGDTDNASSTGAGPGGSDAVGRN